jgi:hypothetical protein
VILKPVKTDDMRHEMARLGGGAHALATQILGNPDFEYVIRRLRLAEWAAAPVKTSITRGFCEPASATCE